ncbi:MAG: peptidase M61 [Flavisolibacter sp.]
MNVKLCAASLVLISSLHTISQAQDGYFYKVDINKVSNNSLSVELLSPKIGQNSVHYSFPKIIPGTYMISDYGKFISNLKAYNKRGDTLPTRQESDDKWQIKNARDLSRITYQVEGIFDTKKKHPIYPMAATSIEKGEDFVFNNPGFFGYFDNLKERPIKIQVTRPQEFYPSTSLTFNTSNSKSDLFTLKNLDDLYDKPIMYTVPDTASIKVGNCKVLFSVYSPKKIIHAREIADEMQPVMKAAQAYLGGKLPVDKYAFIYYFHDPSNSQSFPPGLGGALEHTTSSFYYLPDLAMDKIKTFIRDGSAHEFFHIITPLTIASKEIKQFNYDEPILSKHLWLYEGSTEYTAQYIQERYGLISQSEFFKRLSDKITTSKTFFNDTLPFTQLSKGSATNYNAQYGNVYQKGALIACCLDIYLLHLSKGKYGLRNLTLFLGKKYGLSRAFDDNSLFDEIAANTYPEIRTFFSKYVEGDSALPYDYFFNLAGIKYTANKEVKVFTLGNISFDNFSTGPLIIKKLSNFNEFGKKMGYLGGDEIYTFNGIEVNAENMVTQVPKIKKSMREGEIFEVKAGRKNATGGIDTIFLHAPASKVAVKELNKLEPVELPTEEQLLVQKAWLTDQTDKDFVVDLGNK